MRASVLRGRLAAAAIVLGVGPRVWAVNSLDAGDILAANYGGNGVLRINPVTGVQQRLGVFATPTDLALSPVGMLYISEWAGTVKRLNLANGTVSTVNPGTALRQVWGLTLSPSGDLLVTSGATHSVVKIDPVTGGETLVTQADLLQLPIGIELFDSNHAVVASLLNNQIVSVDLASGVQTSVATGGLGLDQPWGIEVLGADIYVAGYDRKEIQRITAGVVATLAPTHGFPYGIGVESNGNVIAGVSGAGDVIVRVSPAGALLHTFSGGYIRQVTGLEVSGISVTADAQLNTPPALTAVADRSVNEGVLLTFTVTASDTNWPPQNLTFSLEPGAPAGATITSAGVFSWRPTEAQGPSTNAIGVRVTDDGTPPLSATASFTAVAKEVNTAPSLAPIGNQNVAVGGTLTFTAVATDADLPPQSLTFTLEPGAPAGASITPQGVFTWTPAAGQGPSTNAVTVRVSDGGSPLLWATAGFAVVVTMPVAPRFTYIGPAGQPETIRLTFTTVPGEAYRLQCRQGLRLGTWAPLGPDLIATGTTLTSEQSIQGLKQCFYRVLQVQPTPPRFTYIGPAGQPGMIRLTFTTVSGGTYRLQYRQHLRLGAWAPLGPDLIATGTTLTSEQSTQGLAQCLYRVLLVRP